MGGLNKTFARPHKYKDMLIYPIRLIDYEEFEKNIVCLLYDRRKITDPEILKMSYLKFLVFVVYAAIDEHGVQKFKNVLNQLKTILRLSFREDYIEFGYSDGDKLTIHIGQRTIKESEFEKIRKIICEINDIDISDYYLPAEIEEELANAQKIKNQIEMVKSATLEERIFSYHIFSGVSLSEIENYSIYQFKKCMERAGLFIEYTTFKPLEVSGQIKLKSGEIKHWLEHIPPSGRYDDVMIDRKTAEQNLKQAGTTVIK